MSRKQTDADTIRRLESEIHELRQKLRAIAPVEFESILRPWGRFPKDFNPYDWHHQVAPQIIAQAVPLVDAPDRAPCPLCNSHPEQHAGYALPAGLERHLTGKLGQRQCSVVEAAHILIREQWEWERNQPEKSS